MSRTQPIHKAISTILKDAGRPLAASEIFNAIQSADLYDFKAKDPGHVVQSTLRRHCVNLNFPSARKDKYFRLTDDDTYELLGSPVRVEPNVYRVKGGGKRNKEAAVTVPPGDRETSEPSTSDGPTHTEMQWRLLNLGAMMGLSVWAPMEDRGKSWSGGRIADISNLATKLPGQFPPAALRTVKYIDVTGSNSRP